MPEEEREVRMAALRHREKKMDVNFWMKSFLKNMGSLIRTNMFDSTESLNSLPLDTIMTPVTVNDFDAYLTKYIGYKATLALLLDYDGTLSPIAKHPDLAILPPETKKVLERLANRPDVFIAIVSGRSVDNVRKMVGIEGIYCHFSSLKVVDLKLLKV